jgi:parvulin-like peptidyl-prolyl isomerase
MKRIPVLLLVFAFLFPSCNRKAEKMVLKDGTPAFKLARDLAVKIPMLDPVENNVLIRTRKFDITTGETIQVLLGNFGNQTEQLKEFDSIQLRESIETAAVELAEKKLLLQEAERAKVFVDPAVLDEVIKAEHERLGGKEKFLESLKTIEVDAETIMKSLAEQVRIDAFLEKTLNKNVTVTAEEVARTYGEDLTASVRHILLLTQGKTGPEKTKIRKRMAGILARARSGEDFAELAKQYSEEPGSKESGGMYAVLRGITDKAFEDAAFSVPIGQISDIVETTYGYHILQIISREKETRPFDEVKGEIEKRIAGRKRKVILDTFLTKIRDKAGFKTVGF